MQNDSPKLKGDERRLDGILLKKRRANDWFLWNVITASKYTSRVSLYVTLTDDPKEYV